MSFSSFFFLSSFWGEFGVGTKVVVVVKDDGFGLVSKDKRRRFWCGTHHGVDIEAYATRRSSAPRWSSFFFKGRGENKSTFCACIGACSHV